MGDMLPPLKDTAEKVNFPAKSIRHIVIKMLIYSIYCASNWTNGTFSAASLRSGGFSGKQPPAAVSELFPYALRFFYDL